MEPIYSVVHDALHNINSLSQLHIDFLLLFHKVTYHLAQLEMLIVVVVPEMKNHTVVVQQRVHTVEALVSKRDLDGSSK